MTLELLLMCVMRSPSYPHPKSQLVVWDQYVQWAVGPAVLEDMAALQVGRQDWGLEMDSLHIGRPTTEQFIKYYTKFIYIIIGS